MDALLEYDEAIRRNIERVEAVRADQLADPTPCHDWDVAALLAHMIGGHEMFAAALGESVTGSRSAGEPSDARLAARYRDASAASLSAFTAPGAMQLVAALPVGEVTGDVALGLALTDAVVHGWDLAAATGQDRTIDDRVAIPLLAALQATVTADMRQPGGAIPVFAEAVEVEHEDPAGDRLVAFLGRPPHYERETPHDIPVG